jgi:hypothetical protein
MEQTSSSGKQEAGGGKDINCLSFFSTTTTELQFRHTADWDESHGFVDLTT